MLEGRLVLSTVTSLADAGPGSLRQAIAITPAGGTVNFQPGLRGTITLTTGPLTIAKDLTIAGPGSSMITVSGNRASGVFSIGLFPSFVRVSLSGLTIADGRAGSGGGIENLTGTVTVDACILRGNSADFGGGIYNVAGTVTVTDNSILAGNSAGSTGGGIFNTFGTVNVTNSTLSGNSADGGIISAAAGGGIYNAGGTATITDSTLSSNSAGIRRPI